jgi:tRNA A-37 threonylcarbamoyl transferase component Bud32
MNIFYDPLSPWRLPLRFFYPANWCAEGFEEDFAWIQQHPEARNAGNLLTDHNGKYVWRIELPNGHGAVAYKFCEGKAANRYILHLSHPGREWRNYQAIERMGVPSGKVLAFGEKRKHHWKLEESFIITRFIENTRSGIDFMPGGKLRDDAAMRRKFCELLAPRIATMHKHGFFHKALHPRNVLYRGDTPETMEIFFIDVARCKMRFSWRMPGVILFDLYTPLLDLKLPADESKAFLETYRSSFPDCPFTLDELERRLTHYKRHGRVFDVVNGAPAK